MPEAEALAANGVDIQHVVEGISTTQGGTLVFGWAFSRLGDLLSIELQDGAGRRIGASSAGQMRLPRPDVGEMHPDFPQAASSGYCCIAESVPADRRNDLVLVFRSAEGTQLRAPLRSDTAMAGSKAPAARHLLSLSPLLRYAASNVWRMAREGKYRSIAARVAAKLGRRPAREKTPVDRVGRALAKAGLGDCLFIVDHDVGGGANAYRERLLRDELGAGRAVALLTFHQVAGRWTIDVATPVVRERWALDDLDSVLHLAARGWIREIVYNTAVTFPDPVRVPLLLRHMQNLSRAALRVLIHDFFAICPSHYLLDADGRFCGVPDLATCAACLARHGDPYVGLHRSRDIGEWRAAWASLLARADEIVCFSGNTKRYLLAAHPGLDPDSVVVRPHVVNDLGDRKPRIASGDGPLRIGIVGKIGHAKGAEIVRSLAEEIVRRGIDARIVVVGTLEVATPGNVVSESGPYRREDFVDLIERCGANVFLFPSIWPETFSYVAEELMQLGVPLMAFDLGAPGERVSRYARGEVVAYTTASDLLDALIRFQARFESKPPMAATAIQTMRKELT